MANSEWECPNIVNYFDIMLLWSGVGGQLRSLLDMRLNGWLVVRIPFRKLTYPTFGKGNHLQNCHFREYVCSKEGNGFLFSIPHKVYFEDFPRIVNQWTPNLFTKQTHDWNQRLHKIALSLLHLPKYCWWFKKSGEKTSWGCESITSILQGFNTIRVFPKIMVPPNHLFQ